MIFFKKISLALLQLFLAVLVTFVLFVFISILHTMFGIEKSIQKGTVQKHQIIAEIIKKNEPPKKVQSQQRIRQVQSSQPGSRTGQSQVSAKFQPDLSVAAGGEGVELQNEELSAEVFEDGKTDESAQEEYIPPVEFPDRARDLGASGIVKVRFTITYEGKTADIEIVSTPHVLLATEVRKALLNARFKPAKNKGVPVNVRMSKDFEFTLE